METFPGYVGERKGLTPVCRMIAPLIDEIADQLEGKIVTVRPALALFVPAHFSSSCSPCGAALAQPADGLGEC